MNKSGITRKIDELGRIVIPKEIRRMLAIRDEENLEIVVEGEKIILKKYNYLKTIEELGENLINIYKTISTNDLLITDREKVILSTNENFKNKLLEKKLTNLIDSRESFNEKINLDFEDTSVNDYVTIIPIINDIDCIGLVIIITKNLDSSKEELKIAKLISKILAEKLNIS